MRDQSSSNGRTGSAKPRTTSVGLSKYGRAGALACFVVWLGIFAGGILIDTEPYRMVISPSGVAALAGDEPNAANAVQAAIPARPAPHPVAAWAVVMIWFLPLNLALLCVVSAVLGAFGNIANLSSDHGDHSGYDRTNPYISALLRGFFVYLIMISGLLLLDHELFSNPGPEQYIRLAGLLSMFAFMVNYNPQVFNRLLTMASERVESRNGFRQAEAHVEETHLQIERATQVTSVHSSRGVEAAPDGLVAAENGASPTELSGALGEVGNGRL